MKTAAQKGFINATDLADYLVGRGRPFREAYKTVGQLVARCLALGTVLEELPLDEYKAFDPLFESDLYEAISLKTCVSRRRSLGGCGEGTLDRQLAFVRNAVKETEPQEKET